MRAHFSFSVILLSGLILAGCSMLPGGDGVAASTSEWLARAGEAVSARSRRLAEWFGREEASDDEAIRSALLEERQALLDQPYIDPLTHYLEAHAEDPRYADVLTDLSRERDRRCAAIADKYAERPANRENLALYRRGYLYSCPAQVNAFYARVRQEEANRPVARSRPERAPEPETVDAPLAERDEQVEEALSRRKSNDCYLLFTIRNLGEAQEVCRMSAEEGDTRAQRHMGSMAELEGQLEEAMRWYRRAADSGDAQARERLEAVAAAIRDADDEDAR
ncbi:hypothetical protein IOC61_13865 [Halomonas sp. KAO]|uniref:hypothetical protein n=1 Tax=unclassified Halomonas TaxID=2609666 RepID=UPI00189FC453|nr:MULTISPECIES: hypothetical protein [unclassified Halomonas]MBF7054388.1 hypothetical protein [Halomonas sp. KAO]MDT0501216.1 hypothetical protein [Halomonas sp. PAR7]MDT0511405.1 hypothetical protein [Halomonas sp. LES1]MDT0590307.1 hypothetical protein [Halomonas sp. PAR8]